MTEQMGGCQMSWREVLMMAARVNCEDGLSGHTIN